MPPQKTMTASLMAGNDTRTVPATAVKAMAMAAKGKASSSEIILETPKPWAALPTANPRVIGSVIPARSINFLPYWAPKIPVKTTTTTAMAMSPPRIVVTGMAKDVVMLRAKTDNRISKALLDLPPRLIKLAKRAVRQGWKGQWWAKSS